MENAETKNLFGSKPVRMLKYINDHAIKKLVQSQDHI